MPVVNWNTTTIDGKDYLVIDVAKIRVPLEWDPSSNVFIAVAAPTGGILNYPVLAQGDRGPSPDLTDDIDLTALEWDDPNPDAASFSEVSPGVYKLALTLHKGPAGNDADTVLDPNDFDNVAPFKVIRVNSGASGFEVATEKVGNSYWPAVINSTPSGNPTYTLASVSVPAQDFDWKPHVEGQVIVDPTNNNVAVDFVARLDLGGLNAETAGNIMGKGFGIAGASPPPVSICSGPPAGSVATYNRVPAGQSAIIHFRAERRTGTQTFTTSNTTTWCGVEVRPIP